MALTPTFIEWNKVEVSATITTCLECKWRLLKNSILRFWMCVDIVLRRETFTTLRVVLQDSIAVHIHFLNYFFLLLVFRKWGMTIWQR